mgnify:CR=1 FL=1
MAGAVFLAEPAVPDFWMPRTLVEEDGIIHDIDLQLATVNTCILLILYHW